MGRHTWLVSGSSQQQAASHLQLTWSRAPPGLAFVTTNCLDAEWQTSTPHLPFLSFFLTAWCMILTSHLPSWPSPRICGKLFSVCLRHLSTLATTSFSCLFITSLFVQAYAQPSSYWSKSEGKSKNGGTILLFYAWKSTFMLSIEFIVKQGHFYEKWTCFGYLLI